MPTKKTSTAKYDKKSIEDGKALSILSYIGILALIPFFAEKKNKYVVAHAKIGMNLFLIELIVTVGLTIVASILTLTIVLIPLAFIIGIAEWAAGIFFVVVSIIGIVNACGGEVKELPLIGKFKIIK